MNEEEVKEIIKKYSNATFEIVGFEEVDGSIKVIIKFEEAESAKDFEREVTESIARGEETSIIKVTTNIYMDFSRKSAVSLCVLVGLLMLIA